MAPAILASRLGNLEAFPASRIQTPTASERQGSTNGDPGCTCEVKIDGLPIPKGRFVKGPHKPICRDCAFTDPMENSIRINHSCRGKYTQKTWARFGTVGPQAPAWFSAGCVRALLVAGSGSHLVLRFRFLGVLDWFLAFRVEGLGFRVYVLWLRVSGFERESGQGPNPQA